VERTKIIKKIKTKTKTKNKEVMHGGMREM
jgi:hypothetical protein